MTWQFSPELSGTNAYSFLFIFVLLTRVSAIFDKHWCTEVIQSNININNNDLFFPRTFSTITEKSEFGAIGEGLISYSRSTIQFSEASGQMAVESESHDESFSAFADSKLNVCLLHQTKNRQCVKTTQPCDAIGQFTENLRLDQENVSLKSAREILGWPGSRVKTVVKIGLGQTRDINSILYVSCESVENSTATVISQWHFLDVRKYKLKGYKPVLLMSRHQTEDTNYYGPVRTVQTDFVDFKQTRKDNFLPSLEQVDSKCISDNMRDVKKTIPIPPTRFSCIKETRIGHTGGNIERAREVETLYYNYDAQWFHFDTYLTSVTQDEEAEVRFTEDFNTKVRYEICNTGKWCKTFPTLSRAGHTDPDGITRMETPSEFWTINPDTAVYLGEADIRGVPCDAWRVGLPERSSYENITFTLFLATKKWLKRRRLSVESFFPLELTEQNTSHIKYYSYFAFKDTFRDFVPDISPCFNFNHSVGVGLILNTSFYNDIKDYLLQFEMNFRKSVLNVTGLESTLQVASIRAKPSLSDPQQTRISFKILGKAEISSYPRTVSNIREVGSATEAVEKLKRAVQEEKLELKYMLDSTEVHIKVMPESFYLLKDGSCVNYQDNSDETSVSGFSSGAVTAICIAVLVVTLAIGFLAVCVYKRRSEQNIHVANNTSDRPSSKTSFRRSVFGMGNHNVKTEEANWSWAF
ncbi:EF-hand domain-containing protein D1 [Elysia marginata]|uniref:EF-hand domain-containing protein D1 n=1 Tax=Elysia marginata TaxID=1093978 RepID=A0AAV4I638_9GAST|nr:EF-hand domain-containing protein D1 [Elysia marginata]